MNKIGPLNEDIRYQNEQLMIDGISIDKLIQKFGSPFYVYSGNTIRKSVAHFQKAFGSLPVEVHYAVKANSNLSILKLIHSLGCGTDLVSYGEWYRAEVAKVPRKLRILSGVAKTAEEIEKLLLEKDQALYAMHVESAMEFEMIVMIANSLRKKVNVAFRYNPDVDAKTLDKISTGRKYDKFGLNVHEILELADLYADDECVKIIGLSIHIGSQITNLKPFEESFRKLKELKSSLELVLDRKLDYIDLGGGLGVQYRNEKVINLDAYAKLVKKYFKSEKKIILEPGRSLIANAGILVTQSVYSKVRSGHQTLILDSGMSDLVRPAFYEAYHEIVPTKLTDTKNSKWDIVGGICESSDYFAKNRLLATEGFPGESFAILSAGAYGASMSSHYNTRVKIPEILIDRGRVKLIRKKESLQDLLKDELL